MVDSLHNFIITLEQCETSNSPVMTLDRSVTVQLCKFVSETLINPCIVRLFCSSFVSSGTVFSASCGYDLGVSLCLLIAVPWPVPVAVLVVGILDSKLDKSCVSTIVPGPVVFVMFNTRFPASMKSRVTYFVVSLLVPLLSVAATLFASFAPFAPFVLFVLFAPSPPLPPSVSPNGKSIDDNTCTTPNSRSLYSLKIFFFFIISSSFCRSVASASE
mmetsp:Transcript_743/g.1162  ORF Transcript_743/g.1162 Transcript_743/m.1162 type:complete len:216 (-) Transcript_743:294-941(-)